MLFLLMFWEGLMPNAFSSSCLVLSCLCFALICFALLFLFFSFPPMLGRWIPMDMHLNTFGDQESANDRNKGSSHRGNGKDCSPCLNNNSCWATCVVVSFLSTNFTKEHPWAHSGGAQLQIAVPCSQ